MSQRQIDIRVELAPGQMLDAGMLLDFAYVLAGDNFPGPSRLIWAQTLTVDCPALDCSFRVDDDVLAHLLLFTNETAYTRTRVTLERPDGATIEAPLIGHDPPRWDIR